VLAVGRERHVGRSHRATGTDLRGLLAEQRHPDAELALALQGIALAIEPAHQHHVPVQAAQQVRRHLDREVVVAGQRPLRRQQLDQILAMAGRPEPGDHLGRSGPSAQPGGAAGGGLAGRGRKVGI